MRARDFFGLGGVYPALWIVTGAGMAVAPAYALLWGGVSIVVGGLALWHNARERARQRECDRAVQADREATAALRAEVRAYYLAGHTVTVRATGTVRTGGSATPTLRGPGTLKERAARLARELREWEVAQSAAMPRVSSGEAWEASVPEYASFLRKALIEYAQCYEAHVRGVVEDLESTGRPDSVLASRYETPAGLTDIRVIAERLALIASASG